MYICMTFITRQAFCACIEGQRYLFSVIGYEVCVSVSFLAFSRYNSKRAMTYMQMSNAQGWEVTKAHRCNIREKY